MLNGATEKLFHSVGGSCSAVLTGYLAGKNRRLPASKRLAVVDRLGCAWWSNRSGGSSPQTLQRYALLINPTFSGLNGGC